MARFKMSLLPLLSFVMMNSVAGQEGLPDTNSIALGVESGNIPDASLTASSVRSNTRDHSPARGRLNMPVNGLEVGAWVPRLDDDNTWIQVKLNEESWVTGVATQGRLPDIYLGEYHVWHQWVTSYQVGCSLDGESFDMSQIFTGNVDETSVVYNELGTPSLCRYVRIYPKTYNVLGSMRFEVYGLPPNPSSSASCDGPLIVKVPIYSTTKEDIGTHLFDLPPVPAENSLDLEIPFTLKASNKSGIGIMILTHVNANTSYRLAIGEFSELRELNEELGNVQLDAAFAPAEATLYDNEFRSFRITYSNGILSLYSGESTTPLFSHEFQDPKPIAGIGYAIKYHFLKSAEDEWAEWTFDVCNMY